MRPKIASVMPPEKSGAAQGFSAGAERAGFELKIASFHPIGVRRAGFACRRDVDPRFRRVLLSVGAIWRDRI